MITKDYGKGRAIRLTILVAATAIAYHNALQAGFASDDLLQIVHNPDLREWANAARLFTKGVWQTDEFSGGLYRPLAFLSWLVEYKLAGASPFQYHLDNVILHLLCTLMVYGVTSRLVGDNDAAFFSTLVFAVHPVHTEAVTWIACRMELMYSFFTLAAFLVFLSRPRTPRYVILACTLFMAGLLSKETAVVLPAIILLYLFLFEKPSGTGTRSYQVYRLLLPYAATAFVYFLVRSYTIGFEGGVTDIYSNYAGLGPYDMFLVMSRALFEYIRLSFLPFGLSNDYVYSPPPSLFTPKVIIPLALLFTLVVYSPKIARRSKAAFFASAWLFIGLLPVSNIIPAGIVMAERALYLPSMGPAILIGLAAAAADGYSPCRKARYGPLFMAAIIALFILASVERNRFWISFGPPTVVEKLKKRVKAFPYNPTNYRLLAGAYFDTGEYGEGPEKAVSEALRLDPYDADSHYFHAKILSNRSEYEDALNETAAAISLSQPPKAEYFGLAGLLHQKLGRYNEAAGMLDMAIRLDPDNDAYYTAKGNLLLEAGDDDSALELFRKAVNINPRSCDALLGMAIVCDAKADYRAAISNLQKAVSVNPKDPDLRYFLAVSLARSGDTHAAVNELNRALALRPDFEDASALLVTLGRTGVSAPPGTEPVAAGR